MSSAVKLPLRHKNFFDRDVLENLDPRLRHKLLNGFKKIFSSYFFSWTLSSTFFMFSAIPWMEKKGMKKVLIVVFTYFTLHWTGSKKL